MYLLSSREPSTSRRWGARKVQGHMRLHIATLAVVDDYAWLPIGRGDVCRRVDRSLPLACVACRVVQLLSRAALVGVATRLRERIRGDGLPVLCTGKLLCHIEAILALRPWTFCYTKRQSKISTPRERQPELIGNAARERRKAELVPGEHLWGR